MSDLQSSDEARIPHRIGKYKVISRIDASEREIMVRALDAELSQDVIIRMGRRPLPRGQARSAQLAQEGRLLSDLKHHGLARVLYFGWHTERRDDGEVEYPYLVMEYVPGRNLAQFAAEEHPSPMRSAEIIAKVARALATAHEQEIFHRNIKPSSILIEPVTGEPRLVEFAVPSFDGAAPGAPDAAAISFMPPEQASGDGPISARSDVFSLGAALFFLLTGQPPAGDERESLRQIKPPALRAVVARAMAADPAKRYADAGALADDLDRCLIRPQRVRRRWMIALAAALILLLGVAAELLLRQFSQWSRFQRATALVTLPEHFKWRVEGENYVVPVAHLHVTNAAGRPLLLRMTMQDQDFFNQMHSTTAETRLTPTSENADLASLEILVPWRSVELKPGESRSYRCSFDVLDAQTLRRISSPPTYRHEDFSRPAMARILSLSVAEAPDPTRFPEINFEVSMHVDSVFSNNLLVFLRAYTDGRLPRDKQEAQALWDYNASGQTASLKATPVLAELRRPLVLRGLGSTIRPVQCQASQNMATGDAKLTLALAYEDLYDALGAQETLRGGNIWVALRISDDEGRWISSGHDPNMWLKVHLPPIVPPRQVAPDSIAQRITSGVHSVETVKLPPDPDDLPQNPR